MYFGKFPNYFQFWLTSCAANPDFDWLIFTDNTEQYNYPDNVHIYHTTMEETVKRYQGHFDFRICLETPYKLCDFRPAYGEIYYDELKGYDFWGHCDTDLIWGDLSCFITDDILDKYDKIFEWGHCSLYRNTPVISAGYRTFGKINNIGYKEVFSNKNNLVFDESGGAMNWGGINTLFLQNGKRIYTEITFDDLKIAYKNFCSYRVINDEQKMYIEKKKIQYLPSIYRFDEESLKQYLLINNSLVITESMYVHMQKRPMKVKINLDNKSFLIVPNSFIMDQKIDSDIVKKYGQYRPIYLNYLRFRADNLKRKINKRIEKMIIKTHIL